MSFNSGNNPDVVRTELDEVFFAEYEYASEPGIVTAESPVFFKQDSIDRGSVNSGQFGGTGAWTSHLEEESRVLATVRTANAVNRTVLNFKRTLAIPQEFIEDDEGVGHGVVSEAVRHMAFRGRTSRDENALGIYKDAFSGVTTNDAVALISNSHTALDGRTNDNLETGALSAANLEILFRVLLEQRGQDGSVGGHVGNGMLVPPILFPDAQEITKSELKQGTANNDLNYFSQIYPGLVVSQSPFIGSVYNSLNSNAQTSYFLVSRGHSVKRWVRKGIETDIVPPQTDLQDRWFYKGRFREIAGVISWEGIVGSNGTA